LSSGVAEWKQFFARPVVEKRVGTKPKLEVVADILAAIIERRS
jgi:hypothetical protein